MPKRVARRRSRIVVAAGTNGAGKSSIIGEFMEANGGAYFNPDTFARKLVDAGKPPEEANAIAWKTGFDGLRRAIDNHEDFSFETTLGGRSVAAELHRAIEEGCAVHIWYVGLASPDLHIERVRARVSRGGHDIPVAKIRERYPQSLSNLVSFIGKAAEIHVFDNTEENSSGLPRTKLIFRMRRSKIVEPDNEKLLATTPDWAKPIVAAAIQAGSRGRKARKKK